MIGMRVDWPLGENNVGTFGLEQVLKLIIRGRIYDSAPIDLTGEGRVCF